MFKSSKKEVYLKQTSSVLMYIFMLKLISILEEDFLNFCIYLQSSCKNITSLNSDVYFKQTFSTDKFSVRLWSIREVDFLNLCFYVQTLKSILEVYFISTKVRKYKWSIIEIAIKKVPFYFFLFLYFIYSSF